MDLKELLTYGVRTYVREDRLPKREVRPVDRSKFKGDQSEVFDYALSYVMGTLHKNFYAISITGYAGTGKSYVVNSLVEEILNLKPSLRICVTAPTNNAVKHLKRTCEYKHHNLSYRTVHSAFKLKQQIKEDKVIFSKMPGEGCPMDEIDVLFIDEVSMLNKEIYMYTEEYKYKAKIIFVGDSGQLPPVGESSSIPLDEAERERRGIGHAGLSTIIRQRNGSSIIDLATGLREDTLRISGPEATTSIKDMDGVLSYKDFSGIPDLDKTLMDIYLSDAFKENPRLLKFGSYTNAQSGKVNNRVRKLLYGPEVGEFLVGERMVVRTPISDEEATIIMTTNDEFTINDMEEGSISMGSAGTLKFNVLHVDHEEDLIHRQHTVRAVHEDSKELYYTILNNLAAIAKEHPKGSFKALTAWGDFHDFKNSFADIGYIYSQTIHKLQGQTVDTMIVMYKDVMSNRVVADRNRMFYTAVTRPSRLLIL